MAEFIPLKNDGQMMKSKNFSKKSLENHAFDSCSFNSCDFSESILRNAKFCACTFVNCNLSLLKLEGCRFQDARFLNSKIIGAEFFKCDKILFSISFENCLVQYCNFSDLNMKGSTFNGCKLKENYFTNTSLNGADFSDTDLSGTIFQNCDLCKADFSTAKQYDINPLTNKIKKAKFSLPEAIGLLRSFDIIINE